MLNLNRTKVILDNKFEFEGRVVKKIELREYEKKDNNISKEYILKIYLTTENEEIELDYLGKPVSNNQVFDDVCNFLSNYNGLTSTINRIFIELDGKLNVDMKLDWIFVKPMQLTDPEDREQPYVFAPQFGRTLKLLNRSLKDRISDHNPLIVDLTVD